MKNWNIQTTMRLMRGAAEGAAAVAVLVAMLTIIGEVWSPLKDTLKEVFTHHWLGKSALSIVLFALIVLVRSRMPVTEADLPKSIYLAVAATVIASAAMLLFFVDHTFFHFI